MTESLTDFFATFIFVIAGVALASFVILRAWDHRPARIFAVLISLLMVINISILGKVIFISHEIAYQLHAIFLISMALFTSTFVALLSTLFTPEWWQGRRPFIWIISPYTLATLALGFDLFGKFGFFVTGIQVDSVHSNVVTTVTTPAGRWLSALFGVSWLVPLFMMITVFVRNRQARETILVLAGGMIAFTIMNVLQFLNLFPFSSVMRGLILLLPIMVALTIVVFRTRLITPLRAAIEEAFEVMSDAAVVVNPNDQIVYANPHAIALGFKAHMQMTPYLRHSLKITTETLEMIRDASSSFPLVLNGRRFLVSVREIRNKRNQLQGSLVLGRDVTEVEERTNQLEQERARLSQIVQELEQEQRERAALSATVQSLALPVIPILQGVLVIPLVGSFDTERMRDLQTQMLAAIERQQARLVMLDLTGLSFLDEEGAAGLSRSVEAAALLGTRCILVGVRPEIAEAIVAQGLDLDHISTAATLQDAVKRALTRTAKVVAS
ncbi:putative PAS/PAC sensor protein [Oscillochloris trichoides DG-6]|uniref:PAS/PAC sensor protein n=1 Tax=Oscillochloris trichoides DG-6 TaxID=765420 RepID=E1IAT6_9CHLR|nr:STAS domain-containing protein [Oscillochloris trichoides]EFO81692.1 putative PAS/PAC sensor protein [Oscillochloris trichoides DG-6]